MIDVYDYSTAFSPLILKSGATASAGTSFAPPSPTNYLFLIRGGILKTPVTLNLEKIEEEYWLASHPVIMTHGTGDTEQEAISDFLESLADLFLELIDSEEILAPHLKKELDYLRFIVAEDVLQR